jgi:hypothetical protein
MMGMMVDIIFGVKVVESRFDLVETNNIFQLIPVRNREKVKKFQSVSVGRVVILKYVLLISGDFNFHLDDTANTNTMKFNEMLETFGKIELIRENVDRIVVEPPLVESRNPEVKLESFESLSFQDIHDVIMQLSSASCKFDPILPWFVKLCSLELVPSITKSVNFSLQEDRVPDHWKIALLKPILKKLSMEPLFENFRPVSNLFFLSKITERSVANQLLRHCETNAPLPICQSSGSIIRLRQLF